MPVVLPALPAPPAPPLVLDDYQINYGGLTMGGPRDGVGGRYRITSIDGLASLPLLRTSDYARLHHHGAFSGIDVLEGRIITVSMYLVCLNVTDMAATRAALDAATVPLFSGASPLIFKMPGEVQKQVEGRVRKRNITLIPSYNLGWAKVDIEWFCGDPRIYGDALNATTIAPGATTITNNGDFESRPTLLVTPTSAAVGIANAADGTALVLTGSMPSSVVVDLLARTVIDGITGHNRFDLVASLSSWPALIPGPNPISVSGGTVTWLWRHSWC